MFRIPVCYAYRSTGYIGVYGSLSVIRDAEAWCSSYTLVYLINNSTALVLCLSITSCTSSVEIIAACSVIRYAYLAHIVVYTAL